MNYSLHIYKFSKYLQNTLNFNYSENDCIVLLQQTHINLNLNITYEQYIEYLLNLTNDYRNIRYTAKNILQYVKLVDYFILDIHYRFFDYIVVDHIFRYNMFYDKLYLHNTVNSFILNKFSEDNDIDNNTFKYIFEINENICKEIKTLYSKHINQNLLNKCCNITYLNVCSNYNITDLNNLQLLDNLNICDCSVNQNGISQLLFVKTLNANDNNKIKSVNHLQLLVDLNISYCCSVNQNGISQLLFVKTLNANDNNKIKSVNHLQLLVDLNISYCCGVKQNGISQLLHVKKLNINNNLFITDVNHLQQLEELDMSNNCCIDKNDVLQFKFIKKIRTYNK